MVEGLLNSKQVAQVLGVSVKTLRNRCRSARGFPQPVAALGVRRLLWRESDIREYLRTLKPAR